MRLDLAQLVLKFAFWMAIVGVLLNVVELSLYEYPRTTTTARGWTIAKLVGSVVGIFFYPYALGWI